MPQIIQPCAVVAERLLGDGDRLGLGGRARGHGEHQDLRCRGRRGRRGRPCGRGRCRARGRRSRGSARACGSRPGCGSRRSGGRGRTGCRRCGRPAGRSRSRWTSSARAVWREEIARPGARERRSGGRPAILRRKWSIVASRRIGDRVRPAISPAPGCRRHGSTVRRADADGTSPSRGRLGDVAAGTRRPRIPIMRRARRRVRRASPVGLREAVSAARRGSSGDGAGAAEEARDAVAVGLGGRSRGSGCAWPWGRSRVPSGSRASAKRIAGDVRADVGVLLAVDHQPGARAEPADGPLDVREPAVAADAPSGRGRPSRRRRRPRPGR